MDSGQKFVLYNSIAVRVLMLQTRSNYAKILLCQSYFVNFLNVSYASPHVDHTQGPPRNCAYFQKKESGRVVRFGNLYCLTHRCESAQGEGGTSTVSFVCLLKERTPFILKLSALSHRPVCQRNMNCKRNF